jgi:hypothetical protein
MMKQVFQLVYTTCVLALLALPVQAQQWSAEQQEVWQIISKHWELEKAGDKAWIDLLHDSFQGWSSDDLMPLSKADTVRFTDAEVGHFKILAQHTTPVGIVVTGDTAVIHYYHATFIEFDDGERETIDGRFTDILTRTGDGWRFVGWVGEEKGEDD